jgi:hypothetical protein
MYGIYRMTRTELERAAAQAADKGCTATFNAICAELGRRGVAPAPVVVHVANMTDAAHAVAA